MPIRAYRITGEVQGVGFRFWTLHHGRRLGLRGTVRNLRDGSVEVAAEGSESQLAELEDLLRRGPSAARVDRVHPLPPPADLPPAFEITR